MKSNLSTLRIRLIFAFLACFSQLVFGQSISVKFSVDMSLLINAGKFSAASDRVFVKGSFNNWGESGGLTREGSTNVWSASVSLNANSSYQYKFYINSGGAENGGWEKKPGFQSDGNRQVVTGTAAILLPTVYFDNADITLNRSTDHFNFYCASQDAATIPALATKLESDYNRVVTFLETSISQKIEVYVYKNEDYYHNAIGYPEFPDWAVGSALGKTTILMASPYHAGTHDYNGALQIIVHEFVHIAEAWKSSYSLPVWLNEGVATYLASQAATIGEIRTGITSLGRKPELERFENSNTFANNSGYAFAYTIAEFIFKTKGSSKLAGFVGNGSYRDLGYEDKAAFQSAWHTFLDQYYVNTPPPVISISNIRRFGDNWTITYSPHAGSDSDGNTLTYLFTITADGFNKSFTDSNHSGSFNIGRREFAENTTYQVEAKSYDGIVYTSASSVKTFSTVNNLPMKFNFTTPSSGETISFNAEHQFRISWTPTQLLDPDGDYCTDKITITGPAMNKSMSVLGDKGYVLVDSADLRPGTDYMLHGERKDGFGTVVADSVSFRTPGVSGIDKNELLTGIDIYPVPADDYLFIEGYLTSAREMVIEIIDSGGRIILSETRSFSLHFRETLDISHLSPGYYALSIRDEAERKIKTLRKIVMVK
jgi:hypothetical protein